MTAEKEADRKAASTMERIVRWIEEDAAGDVRDDPYRVVYRNADVPDAPLYAIDDTIRTHLGVALDDPRRLRFLVWALVDERCREGHSAVPLADVYAHLERRAACTQAAASEAVRFMAIEGAMAGLKTGQGVRGAALQLAPYARAEEEIAAWVVDRLREREG